MASFLSDKNKIECFQTFKKSYLLIQQTCMKYLVSTEDKDIEDNSLWPLEVQITRDHSNERGRALKGQLNLTLGGGGDCRRGSEIAPGRRGYLLQRLSRK